MKNKIAILPKLYDANGNIRKKWFVYFSYRNPADNKMTRFRLFEGFGTVFTKKERYAIAEKMIADYTTRLHNGWNPFAEDPRGAVYDDNLRYATVARVFKQARASNNTFNYYSNLFLPEVKGMAEKTYLNYVSKFRIFDSWLTANGYAGNDISTLTPAIMQQFFLHLINDEKLARITVKKYQHMLERMFTWCIAQKYIKHSPMENLPETTRRNDHAPRPIHEADIDSLVTKIREKDPQLWLTIQLEYYCLLRPGLEIRFARVGWFDFTRSVIEVPAEVVKTRENKTVIIPKQLRETLMNDWKINLFPREYYIIGKNGVPGPEPVGSNNLRNRFNIIRDSLNLPDKYKLYSWKHTGNVRVAKSGISLYDLQQQNGHLSMRSTEAYMKNKIGFYSEDIEENYPTLEDPFLRTKPKTDRFRNN